MYQETLTVLKYTNYEYKLKKQLFSNNTSHRCLPNVEVWENMERGITSAKNRLGFSVLGIDSVVLDNTDIAILSYHPKTEFYKVGGYRRKVGAIGKMINFEKIVRAENSVQAGDIVRIGSMINEYEHVHIVKIEEV